MRSSSRTATSPLAGVIRSPAWVGTGVSSILPPATPAGEIWLVHQTGTFLKLCNDGTVQVRGDLHVSGDIYDAKGSLSRMRGHYDSHTHVDSRGGTTSAPNQQD